ncbi:MAG: hypothetical protein NT011_10820 [Kiritimatiellaeota bacterium]|nr:hypothetical protein [Kiritimatiellota bacterium]
MNGNKVIMKCCVCGREKTDQGWQYTFQASETKIVYSHGFCSACYDVEVMKVKMRLAMPAMAALR